MKYRQKTHRYPGGASNGGLFRKGKGDRKGDILLFGRHSPAGARVKAAGGPKGEWRQVVRHGLPVGAVTGKMPVPHRVGAGGGGSRVARAVTIVRDVAAVRRARRGAAASGEGMNRPGGV